MKKWRVVPRGSGQARTYLINRNEGRKTTSSGAKAQFLLGLTVGAEAATPVAPIDEIASSGPSRMLRATPSRLRASEWGEKIWWGAIVAFLCLVAVVGVWGQGKAARTPLEANAVGIFEGHSDVGDVGAAYAGNVEYDAAKGMYTVTGGGENIWFDHDAFQYVWTRGSGDVTLAADVGFLGAGKNPHRKAVLMVRQNLEADAAYVDIAVHGAGLTSLQYRDEKGGTTHEVQANVDAPKRVKIVKRRDYFTMWVAGEDGKFALAGATGKIALKEPFYVGIGVCSHEKDLVERAVFSRVEVKESNQRPVEAQGMPATSDRKERLYSMLEIMTVDSTDRRAIYVAEGRFEAPNWMPDGKSLIFNRNGRIEKIAVTGGTPETVDTGFAVRCNNDHGISPDGKELVVSDQSQSANHQSQVYILPIGGGTPRLITKNSPSYWHGWSPEGKTLAFVGQRNGEFDIYTISTAGGEETRLTTAKGLDDGPEYTPNGKYIYFNSERTGHMQIWKMKADGSEQTQVTNGAENDWFPHFSPDGEQMVFLTYDPSVTGHPENKDVMLRMMTMKDGKIQVLGRSFGGQGTINVPSWSPDGKRFAFVSYALVEEQN
jgi:TolB protein